MQLSESINKENLSKLLLHSMSVIVQLILFAQIISCVFYSQPAHSVNFSCELLYLMDRHTEAVKSCETDARNGNASAAKTLAKMYRRGVGVNQSEAMANVWDRWGDKLRNEAIVTVQSASTESDYLNICTSQIKNITYEESFSSCEVAAKLGSVEAQTTLASKYKLGHAVEKSEDMARYWYEQAAKNGSTEAAFYMARDYSKNGIDKRNWLQHAISKGHLLSIALLAKDYEELRRFEDAAILYKRIAGVYAKPITLNYFTTDENDDAQAIINSRYKLGLIYLKGEGVLQNNKLAFDYIKSAAEYGHEYAQMALSKLYQDGVGVSANKIMAHAWLNVAAARGFNDAVVERGLLAARMTTADIDKAQEIAKHLVKSQ
jgi:TPR repeat protein